MAKLVVNVNNPYEIEYCTGGINNIAKYICDKFFFGKIFVLTDKNVASLYLKTITELFKKEDKEVFSIEIEPGDNSKNLQTYSDVINAMTDAQIKKDDLLIALGGGVVGDLAGFVAASYMRGISLINVPTTFLAQIDSSIGGKSSLNSLLCKNIIGTICQPKLVYIDINLIKTLPVSEIKNGLGEAIKYGILIGGEPLAMLEKGLGDSNIERFIQLCGQYKASLVETDENDNGKRRILNLGHTIGHAIEAASGYSINHGLAVAKGLKFMLDYALNKKSITNDEYAKIISLFEKYAIDTSIDFSSDELFKYILLDKKGKEGKISFVEIVSLGYCRVRSFDKESFKELLDESLSSKI